MSEKIPLKGWYSKDYRYSRHGSRNIWKRVNAIKDRTLHHELYEKGCRLQNLEGQFLEALKAAERIERG